MTASATKETVGSALTRGVSELIRAQVEAPRLTAELLLGYQLGLSRVQILTHPESGVDPAMHALFLELVMRRAAGEPLQYILGEQEFYGLRFRVTPSVLIPRSETELLVEEALSLAANKPSAVRFIDVGTGSGCIAVSFAKHLPLAIGWAVDASQEALKVARENAIHWGVLDRMQFVQGDLLECFHPSPQFDFVLSNPPYVTCREYESLPVMVRDHEPGMALLGGESGLASFGRLIPQASRRLKPGGYLLLEIGAGPSDAVSALLQTEDLIVKHIAADLRGIPRCIIAQNNSRSVNG